MFTKPLSFPQFSFMLQSLGYIFSFHPLNWGGIQFDASNTQKVQIEELKEEGNKERRRK